MKVRCSSIGIPNAEPILKEYFINLTYVILICLVYIILFEGFSVKQFLWDKPVLSIFKERDVNPEIEPFVVIKAKKLTVTRSEDSKLTGDIQDFFKLMGDPDYLSSAQGLRDHYVICWFDDTEPDTTKDFRRLTRVTFNEKLNCQVDKNEKKTYNGSFKAEHGKLE